MLKTIRDLRAQTIDIQDNLSDLTMQFGKLSTFIIHPRNIPNLMRAPYPEPISDGLEETLQKNREFEALRVISIVNNCMARARAAFGLLQEQGNLAQTLDPENDAHKIEEIHNCALQDDVIFNGLLDRATAILKKHQREDSLIPYEHGDYDISIDTLHARRQEITFTPSADPNKTIMDIYNLRLEFVGASLNGATQIIRRLKAMGRETADIQTVMREGTREYPLNAARFETRIDYFNGIRPEIELSMAGIQAYLMELEQMEPAGENSDIKRPLRYLPLSVNLIPEITP
ncbi:MAG: hypothetical protein DI551_01820 [Micavibrio aeruginosavorus]|uniref:Uncharacterized protein n=1 Tax=Micavibrio aeruginosavorus TaxID=349221 RepID=A0A2W5N405_9BACT|nr:MAG: hypothetical protein DI551_01820 [Micavibrio aeruginosavorus]